ncbi:hypothetical protein [Chryseobacterium sp.]|uniref:hypothetical protein n=1 Tax=Chryseobacterium sp. TaxID=1871047 RepID=UPI00321A89A8
MDKTLGSLIDKEVDKVECMAAFKFMFQKNRESKKQGKIYLDELGHYQQMFEANEITVKKFIKSPEESQKKYLRKFKNSHEI